MEFSYDNHFYEELGDGSECALLFHQFLCLFQKVQKHYFFGSSPPWSHPIHFFLTNFSFLTTSKLISNSTTVFKTFFSILYCRSTYHVD